MSITVTKTNNEALVVIQDGVNDTDATSLNLLGRNFIGYSPKIADNFVHLLEHFANDTAPTSPLTGQLWFDTSTSLLKYYEEGIGWKVLANTASGPTAPTSPLIGDLWFDTINQQLDVWTGSEWLVIGPSTPSGYGFTGIQVASLLDTLSVSHIVGELYIDGNLITIINQDAEFTPANATISSSFGNLKSGYNLTGSLPAKYWNGIATNSDKLGGFSSTDFIRANVSTLTTGALTFQNDNGITIGQGLDYTISVSGIDVSMKNNSTGGDISIITGNTAALSIDGGTYALTASSSYGTALLANANAFSSYSLVTLGYVDAAVGGGTTVLLRDGSRTITGNLVPNLTLAYDFGSASTRFATIYSGNANVSATASVGGNLTVGGLTTLSGNTSIGGTTTTQSILPAISNAYDLGSATSLYRYFYGTAIKAEYADLAEIYATDYEYEPGTIVCFGGDKEITASTGYANVAVAGVVSRNPGYLMNAKATGLPVALRGKVECAVTGKVSKGNMLVTSTIPGVACASLTFIGGAIIGKSLEDADFGEGNVGTINIVVGSI